MKKDILESIGANYILQFEELDGAESKLGEITPEFFKRAKKTVDDDFNEIIKSHAQEEQIKLACLQYYVAIYFLIITDASVPAGTKVKLRELIAQHNQVGDLLQSLQNFDHCMGSCGMAAQNLCQK